MCKDASAAGNGTGASGGNGSYGGGVEGKLPSRGNRYVAATSHSFVQLMILSGYTSQASRSTAWGYSILFLALSTVAFSMAPY